MLVGPDALPPAGVDRIQLSRLFKRVALRPLARVLRLAQPVTSAAARAWAWCRLAASLPDSLDPSVVALGMPDLHGSRQIALGRDLYLYRELHLETQGAGRIHIGNGVVLSRGVHLVSHFSIEIGPGAMIGEYASLRDANHVYGGGASPRNSGHSGGPIVIGADVWIGRGAAVLPGVTIGAGAVIGANAVVTRNVPAGAVVAGVPARPIERRAA